jgi:hypothetical protein
MESFYQKYTIIKEASYETQKKKLFEQSYVYSDSFSRGMNALGHCADEIIYDFKSLQITWAKENNVKFNLKNWREDILLAQIGKIKPDILYFQDIYSLPFYIKKRLKEMFPFIKLITIFRGFPGVDASLMKELSVADILIVGSPVLKEKCRKAGLLPFHIYHFFDDLVLDRLKKERFSLEEKKYDFVFNGSSGFSQNYYLHSSRYKMLTELINKTDLLLWVEEQTEKISSLLWKGFKQKTRKVFKKIFQRINPFLLNRIKRYLFRKIKKLINEIEEEKKSDHNHPKLTIPSEEINKVRMKPLSKLFPTRCFDPVYGLDMYKLFSQSKITFNSHSQPAGITVDNMRMFQATGMKSCLLVNYGENLSDLFVEDKEVVVYSSIPECIEKARYLLDNDKVREEIAKKGQLRTLKDHTVLNRCKQIDEIIQKKL